MLFRSESIKLFGHGGYFLTVGGMESIRRQYLGEGPNAKQPGDPYVSPLMAPNLAGLPPALVITAEFDPLRSEGEAYVERLRAANVPARAHRFAGVGHGFFSMTSLFDEADEAMDDIAAVLKSNF